MNAKFRALRIKQLSRALIPFAAVRATQRPPNGWLAAIREASGISLRDLASRVGVAHQNVALLEKSEAEDTITLKKLRATADALACDLVYALVPRTGTLEELVADQLKDQIRENVTAVEHTMSLEDQAVGGVSEKIEEELRHKGLSHES